MMFSVFILLGLFLYFLYHEFIEKRRGLPPGPIPLPLVGNVLQIGPREPGKRINSLREKYGPVFTIWLGIRPMVVITDYNILKQTLVKQPDIFAGRPLNFVTDYLRKGHAYGVVVNDGPIWKQQRRFALHVLRDFGFGRPLMEEKITTEIDKLITNIDKVLITTGSNVVSFNHQLELCIANVVSSLLMGHTLEENTKFPEMKKLLDDLIGIAATPQVLLLGQMPWLRFLPFFGRFGFSKLRKARDAIYDFLGKEIKEHRENFIPDQEPSDYTAAFLKEMHRRERAGEDPGGFTAHQLLAAVMDMFLAGQETTFTTLKWALLYMLHYPEIQDKCRGEIEKILENRQPKKLSMNDRLNTPFLAATLAEIQRCANIIHVTIFHRLTKNTHIQGYCKLKKDTMILPQMSAVLSDDRYFPEQEKFYPYRHLNGDGTLKSLEFLVPFSMGKRQCLGEPLARMELYLIFGSLIQNYKFSVPPGMPVPSLEPRQGLVRSPRGYDLHVEKTH